MPAMALLKHWTWPVVVVDMSWGMVMTATAAVFADASSLAYESSTYGRSYLGEFMVERAMRNGWAAGSIEQAFA